MTGQNEDAVWREIVANYGDRPAVDAGDTGDPGDMDEAARAEETRVEEQAPHPDGWHEERFVPPPPPPLPRVAPDRLAAWLGVFVSPALLLIATVLRISLPTFVAWLLVAAFLGGFGYLVAQMPRGPRDPFDDGARL